MDEWLEKLKCALVSLDLERDLRRKFPACEPRCPPSVTVAAGAIGGIYDVHFDLMLRVNPGAEKSFPYPGEPGNLVQNCTARIQLLRSNIRLLSVACLAKLVDALYDAAIKELRAVHLYESSTEVE